VCKDNKKATDYHRLSQFFSTFASEYEEFTDIILYFVFDNGVAGTKRTTKCGHLSGGTDGAD
jgi:hypothetical protein